MQTAELELLSLLRAEIKSLREMVLPLLLTYDEAAEQLRVSTKTIRRMVQAGELASVEVSKSPRIPRAELERVATPPAATPVRARRDRATPPRPGPTAHSSKIRAALRKR